MSAVTLAQAREFVLAACAPLPAERVPVADALGRVLAQPLQAHTQIPAFDNSAMDGFAIAAGPAGRRLRIAGESRAGAPADAPLGDGEAIRISTGAAVPRGATAVIQLEHATEEDDGHVITNADSPPGANLRRAGEDMAPGRALLDRGARLGARELAVAVAAGHGELAAFRVPRVAVIATGDELRPPGAPLGPGEIHDSNSLAMAALAREGGASVVSATRVGDDPRATRDALAAALRQADVLTISGGVSVGPHDHVKQALAELGVEQRFWGIAIRPGRPTWFGTRNGTLVFGLPGNPVSTIVIHALLVRPALAALTGADPRPGRLTALLAHELPRQPNRDEAVRVRIERRAEGLPLAHPCGPQASHVTTSLLGADGLALIEAGEGVHAAGAEVEVELL